MAGRDRVAGRGAGQGAGGRGRQPGAPLPRGRELGAVPPRGQQAGAALPRGQQAGAGQEAPANLPRGEAQPAAARPRALHGEAQVRRGTYIDVPRNENRVVSTDNKVIKSGTPFKSEHTMVKTKNTELLGLYAEMTSTRKLICSGSTSKENWSNLFAVYNQFSDKVDIIHQEIKQAKEMPLPVPKALKKKIRRPRFEE